MGMSRELTKTQAASDSESAADDPARSGFDDAQHDTQSRLEGRILKIADDCERLANENEKLKALMEKLSAENEKIKAENEELRRRLGMNSRNSSMPPSSDKPWNKGVRKPKSKGKKRGAQRGHKAHFRALVPTDEVDHVVVCPPSCGREEIEKRPGFRVERFQVFEAVKLNSGHRIEITEYQILRGRDVTGRRVSGALPPDVPRFMLGPQLIAFFCVLIAEYRLSRRKAQSFIETFFGLHVSLGTIVKAQRLATASLEPCYREAREFVKTAGVVNVDDTSFKEEAARRYLWVVVTHAVTVFLISEKRNGATVKDLIGEHFGGFLGSDQHSSFRWLKNSSRQLCWAHLERKFRGFASRSGVIKSYGLRFLELTGKIFDLWWKVRDGTLARVEFRRTMEADLIPTFENTLTEAAATKLPKFYIACDELCVLNDALWTFVRQEGVEPTNNASEQALRTAVIWRKLSFGSQSPAGTAFVERMLTVIASLKKQGRCVLAFIEEAYRNAFCGVNTTPSLLPG
jgi:regulator of replication initiation timing